MDEIEAPERIDHGRRRFLGAAAMTSVALDFAAARAASATVDPARIVPISATEDSLVPLKQIDAGVLSVGYAELGPSAGAPVLLLHGWPYDIHAFVDVAPLLASKGYRVVVPHLRGYGTTRFLADDTMRNGEPAANRCRHRRVHGRLEDR
jgi:alpha/beta hydrolase fold